MFFGTSAFAVPALHAAADHTELVAVVTQPDRPAGRGQKLNATPVKGAARELGLEVLTPTKLGPLADDLRELGAERCIVASYGRIVPSPLLAVVPLWLNLHPSLLPLYRGATPLQSVLRDGRLTTAVSIIAMDAGMDTGDLLAQSDRIAIGAEETYGELHDRLAVLAARLLVEVLAADARGRLERVPQARRALELGIGEDEIAGTLTRPWTKADAQLRPAMSAREIHDLVRALAPRPGATLRTQDLGDVKLLRTQLGVAPNGTGLAAPLSLLAEHGALFLRAADGWLGVERVLPAGRAEMSAAAFVAGRRLSGALV